MPLHTPGTHAIYTVNPGLELGRLFQAHVKATAQPETFPNLSTSRPPDDGELVVLAFPISVDRGRRPDRLAIPCPVCSATTPKWLHRGSFIWCEATMAIYCVGPRCGTEGWASQRLTTAQNVFLREETAKLNAERLASEIRAVPSRLAWIAHAKPVVERADILQTRLAKTLPKLKLSMHREAKASDTIRANVNGQLQSVGRIRGVAFLSSTWRNSAKLDGARTTLETLARDAPNEDLNAWAQQLAPTQCKNLLDLARNAAASLEGIADKMAAATAFLTDETALTLATWSQSRSAPFGYRFVRTAANFSLAIGENIWRARIGEIEQLPPLP